jgi:hypothetical protein
VAQTRRSMIASALAVVVMMSLTLGTALAAELFGTIKSVDVDNKKIVVTEKDTDKDIEVTIKDDTEWVSPKGKSNKKYDLAKAKKGSHVEITHEDAVASKVVVKKYAKKEFSGK